MFRWVPLYSNVLNPNSHFIPSPLNTHFLSLQCQSASAHLIWNSVDQKKIYLVFSYCVFFGIQRELLVLQWVIFNMGKSRKLEVNFFFKLEHFECSKTAFWEEETSLHGFVASLDPRFFFFAEKATNSWNCHLLYIQWVPPVSNLSNAAFNSRNCSLPLQKHVFWAKPHVPKKSTFKLTRDDCAVHNNQKRERGLNLRIFLRGVCPILDNSQPRFPCHMRGDTSFSSDSQGH